jgi:hypothetical protein
MKNITHSLKYAIIGLYTYVYSLSMFVPVLALPIVITQNTANGAINGTNTATTQLVLSIDNLASTTLIDSAEVDDRAVKIDAYFAQNNLPLAGYGKSFVDTADKYNLDWRLLPAIAMRESTGGKFACPNGNRANVFGWASCRVRFSSYDEAIDKVGAHLAGEVKSTSSYYKGRTTTQKLKRYNSVIPSYTKDIFAIMNKIENIELAMK